MLDPVARTRVHEPAYLVTTATQSPQEERRQRERRYLILMGIRVIAVIGAIVVGTQFHLGALVAVLVVAALVLPWVAVVVANAPKRPGAGSAPATWSPHRRRLTSGPPPRDP
jgi:hypothetical protein